MEKIFIPKSSTSLSYKVIMAIIKRYNNIDEFVTKKKISKYSPQKHQQKVTPNPLIKLTIGFEEHYIAGIQTFVFNSNGNGTLVYFHGGAYMKPPLKQHFDFLHYLALKTNMKIYMPIYPRAPFYNCSQCYEKLKEWFNNLGICEIILGGDSSGGAIALILPQVLKSNKSITITKSFSISPWIDISLKNPLIENYKKVDEMLSKDALLLPAKLWKGELSNKSFLHSPINSKIPNDIQILLINGTKEIMTPDIALFCEKNASNNITWYEYEKMDHAFPLFPCSENKNAREKIVDFLLKK